MVPPDVDRCNFGACAATHTLRRPVNEEDANSFCDAVKIHCSPHTLNFTVSLHLRICADEDEEIDDLLPAADGAARRRVMQFRHMRSHTHTHTADPLMKKMSILVAVLLRHVVFHIP